MGMPDFYIKINFKESAREQYNFVCKAFGANGIFRILDEEDETKLVSIECKIDNFMPSVVIVFDTINKVKDCISSIETYGITRDYDFNEMDEFMSFVFSSNKEKILAYYKQTGYFAIDSDKYYENRNKLKKYYKKPIDTH